MAPPDRSGRSTFLLGGARSGKSTLAQRLADADDGPVTVVVTADADRARADGDIELLARIGRHRADRPAGWSTVEAGPDLPATVAALPDGTLVVDCVTLWLGSLVDQAERAEVAVADLVAAIGGRRGDTIVVSNEVGHGVVPATAAGRSFRDLQGRANQALAAACDRSLLVVAGRALALVDPAVHLEELALEESP